jgi:dihydroxyacetone kinase
MAINRTASSTMGTLLATAFLRMGKEMKGLEALTPNHLAAMLNAADVGIQERGKAQLGDKTVIDALHPAAEVFMAEIENGADLASAGHKMVEAARQGRDRVTPLRSKIGRSSWVGERTIGLVDGGCEVMIILLEAIVYEQTA